ncbi:MAG: hypothetical protein KKA81_16805 [Bacteroidetes bacterium]|nr:hypothetical protein [Bacteroidota bacterium]
MKLWKTECIEINLFISMKHFKVAAITAWLIMAAGNAGAITICRVPCGVNTETRNYSYNGYLSDLTVASSQTLPFSLEEFYGALNLTPDSPVPVSLSLTVKRSEEFLGSSILARGHDYWYSMNLGNLSIRGSILGNNTYGISSFAVSPFKNDHDNGSSIVDELYIFDTDYKATVTNQNIKLASREGANTQWTLSFFQDLFNFRLVDNTAAGLDGDFPGDGSLLETMFDSGKFALFGDIQVTDDNGTVLSPFSDSERFLLNGTIDSSQVSFQPTTEQMATVCTNLLLCGGSVSLTPVVPAVPVPSAVWFFGSGLIGIIGLARRQKEGNRGQVFQSSM